MIEYTINLFLSFISCCILILISTIFIVFIYTFITESRNANNMVDEMEDDENEVDDDGENDSE